MLKFTKSSEQFITLLKRRWILFCPFNNFIRLGYHLPNFRQFLLPITRLHLSLHFLLSRRLECIRVHIIVIVLPISKRVVIERTIIGIGIIGIGLCPHNLPPDLFHLFLQRQFVFSLLLQPSHHLIYSLISLLFQCLVLSLYLCDLLLVLFLLIF